MPEQFQPKKEGSDRREEAIDEVKAMRTKVATDRKELGAIMKRFRTSIESSDNPSGSPANP